MQRWSPRDFNGAPMPEEKLLTMLEAARWAPSSYNIQPWRFIYVQREDASWDDYCELLVPANTKWATHAAALVFILSDTLMPIREDKPASQSSTHSFDAGIAFAHLALQATMLGYHTHAMAGVEREKARSRLEVPERYAIEVAVAIGSRAQDVDDTGSASNANTPSQRHSLASISGAGTFSSLAE